MATRFPQHGFPRAAYPVPNLLLIDSGLDSTKH
jgi:hypothetical protein